MKHNRIVHISTVHSSLDPRIRLKQLRSIAAAGFEALFITGDPTAEDTEDGVTIQRITSRRRGRLSRMLLLAPKAVWIALRTPAAAYHFHDPELLPWAWLLLFRRVPVFYDIHEDYRLAMEKKYYLPPWSRKLIGALVGLVEHLLSWPYHRIIAEHAYARRFPRATPILNYPNKSLMDNGSALNVDARHLLYTGYVTVERGALNLARVARDVPDIEITLVGRCFPDVAGRIHQTAAAGAERLHLEGVDRYVPFQEITSWYARKTWLAGIVLIPDVAHFKDKHLTKFFEFMAFGLPVIASDFPEWRRLIADQGLGICVDPEDPQAVARAVTQLRNNPEETRHMGLRGRELVKQEYNWEGQAKSLLELYKSCGILYKI